MNFETYHSTAEVPENVDSVVILGKQLGIGSSLDDIRSAPDRLSMPSRFNIIGGAMLWTPERKLIISGNDKAYFPSAAVEFLMTHFPEIPYESYNLRDTNSPDTLASAKNIPPILEEANLTNTILTSLGKHGIRAATLFYNYGTTVQGVAISDVIVASRSANDKFVVDDWNSRLTTKLEFLKEYFLRFDKNAYLSRYFTKIFRP